MTTRLTTTELRLTGLAVCNSGERGPFFPSDVSQLDKLRDTPVDEAKRKANSTGGNGGERVFTASAGVDRISGVWAAARIHFRSSQSGQSQVAGIANRMCNAIGRAPAGLDFAAATGTRDMRDGRLAAFACVWRGLMAASGEEEVNANV